MMKSDMDARVSQSEIPQVYDSLSKTYDIWGKLAETKARNRAIELADIHDGQKILEVAVGKGLVFFEIVQRNPNGTNNESKKRVDPGSLYSRFRAFLKSGNLYVPGINEPKEKDPF